MVQHMKIKYGIPFSIPRRLGTRFKDVVSIKGVKYIKRKGFVVENKAALDSLNRILVKMGLILSPQLECFICKKEVDCEKCFFKTYCRKDTKTCICQNCLERPDLVKRYSDIQRELLSIG